MLTRDSLNELVAGLILFPGWTRADGVNFEGECTVISSPFRRAEWRAALSDQITNTTGDLSQEQLSADWKGELSTYLWYWISSESYGK